MAKQFRIRWHDSGREPQCAPNPAYPQGIDVNVSMGAIARCKTALPYPARRCGYYEVICKQCKLRIAITTAGRPDDPRSVILPCKQPAPHRETPEEVAFAAELAENAQTLTDEEFQAWLETLPGSHGIGGV